MHITGMTIANIPPFTEPIGFHYDERVNVFIGPNASGKSTALRLLRRLRHTREQSLIQAPLPLGLVSASVSNDWPLIVNERTQNEVPDWREMPFIEIAAIRGALPLVEPDFVDSMYLPALNRGGTVESILESDDALSNFSGARVEQLINLMIEDVGAKGNDLAHTGLARAVDVSFSCSKRICSEIVQGDSAENLMIRFGDLRDANDGMSVSTIDDNLRVSSHLEVHRMSSGVQTSLLWVRFLALKMLHFYGYADGWEKKPAILLIDEIENHLHPTWQRRVIPALLDHFPGLQIFATTHSPFVVAGLKAGQVHLLNRDENGVVTASANTENIEGWTADEILRVFMGVDEPTDELTAQAARELRRLRDQPPVTDEQGEEERQAEIRRLRQIVNRAELSGPRAAEDSRFLADLRSILHRYSQSQNLNQENG